LKPGAPMLVYIYYAFDNRPAWFRLLWRASDYLRRAVANAPFRLKSAIAELFAALVYWPLARGAKLFASRAAVAAVFMDNTLTSVAPVSLLTACRMSNFN
jgi:hypothetical protein